MHVRNARFRCSSTLVSVLVPLICLLAGAAAALARDEAVDVTFTSTNVLDKLGDCHSTLQVQMPPKLYALIKKSKEQNTDSALLDALQSELGVDGSGAVMDDEKTSFRDESRTVVIEYVYRGFARSVGGDNWEASLGENSEELKLLPGRPDARNVVEFQGVDKTCLGLAFEVLRLKIPASGRDLKVREEGRFRRITYRLPQSDEADDTGQAAIDMTLTTRDKIMSCLGKSYGNGTCHMSVARMVFKNTGDQTLRDYRIRFRLADYSNWTPWMRSAVVAPGQTVADDFFPALDEDKVNQITEPRPVNLEVEVEYRTADKPVHKPISHPMELLGPNQVVFARTEKAADGSVPARPLPMDWKDKFENAPYILASFVSFNDDVMGQLAGGVNRMVVQREKALTAAAKAKYDAAKQKYDREKAKNPDAEEPPEPKEVIFKDDERELAFAIAMYRFMQSNHIACRQNPPGRSFEGHRGQRVQFGHDVLRSRGGTPIDLAILYVSACESSGVRTEVILVPGHVYPAVIIEGELIPIDIEMVNGEDFIAAAKSAKQVYVKAKSEDRALEINIRRFQNRGYRSLDFPKVEPNFLENLGYKFDSTPSQ